MSGKMLYVIYVYTCNKKHVCVVCAAMKAKVGEWECQRCWFRKKYNCTWNSEA